MNATSASSAPWGQRLLVVLLLVLLGAGVALWGLSRWDAGARLLGFERIAAASATPARLATAPATLPPPATDPRAEVRLAMLEERLASVERATARVEGSAGRADALLIAFAARRAIDRGVSLGYLETLLVERFGARHEADVATVISASHQPIRLDQLIERHEALADTLRAGGPSEGWWSSVRRELGGLVTIRRADAPNPRPAARFERASAALATGKVDIALAETMRLPGAAQAGAWVADARRYIRAHRALDALESAALLGGGRTDAMTPAGSPPIQEGSAIIDKRTAP